jgi:hypothetical protein
MTPCSVYVAPYRHPDCAAHTRTIFFDDPDGAGPTDAAIALKYNTKTDKIVGFARKGRWRKRARLEHHDYLRELFLIIMAQAALLGDDAVEGVEFELPIKDTI